MRLVICDDHQLLVESLAALVATDGHEVAATLNDPGALPEAVAEHTPDVCILDALFPGRAAEEVLDVVAALRADSTKVVVLTGYADDDLAGALKDRGASAVVSKQSDSQVLLDALRRIGAGQAPAPAPARARPRREEGWTFASLSRFLTDREREVLEGLVHGESTAELAARLNVRVPTARSHIQNLLVKLCVHSRLEAVALAVRYSMVSGVGDESAEAPWRGSTCGSATR